MLVFRLTREKYAGSLSGKGAALKGARWNSTGVELVYSSGNRSLAMAELAVHFSLATLPGSFVMLEILIPEDITMIELTVEQLPEEWKDFPFPSSTQKFGDRFVSENKYCVLKVPSAVTQGDHNYLINPRHPDFSQIKIIRKEKFPLDKRIFK